jgi:hypothetical protein
MTITTNSTFHRTARLGVCVLIGVAALTACGDPESSVATGTGAAPKVAAPAAPYVAPEMADRAAQLAVRNEKLFPTKPYVSPEQADRAAMLAVRAEKFSADAIERRAAQAAEVTLERQADLDLGTALTRAAAVEKVSAHASADSLDRNSSHVPTSAHRSADAIERWALSESGS